MPHGHKPGTMMVRFVNVVVHFEGANDPIIGLGDLKGGGDTVNEAWHELCDRINRDYPAPKYDVLAISYDDWKAA